MTCKYDTVIFDLDGTIIDVRLRLYTLFKELTSTDLSYEQYWELKDKGYKQAKMLSLIGFHEDKYEFNKSWLENVESWDLLMLDTVKAGVIDKLNSLKLQKSKIYLVTNRQNEVNLIKELKLLKLHGYFEKIITTLQRCSKSEAIEINHIDLNNAVIIGDSQEDMDTADCLNIDKIFVREH